MFREPLRVLFVLAAIVVFAIVLALIPSYAAIPLSSPEPEATQAPAPAIEETSQEGSDERIARRILSIFDQLPELSGVDVSVREGVVKLTGEAAQADDAKQAEQIASRVKGVVTVVNDIERDTSVGETVGSLQRVTDKASALVAMLPLVALALGVAVAIALLGYLLASFSALWHRIAPNGFLAELIASAIRFIFVIGGVVVALDMLGAGALLGAVLGGAGVIGLALGFAMRDTVENYVASIMLSVRQPFRANDHVVIEDMEGRVVRLTSRATILMTLDGNHLRIPNSSVFKAVILNYTRNPQRRFDFELGIDAEDDANAARRLGVSVLEKLPFVLDDPPPQARVEQVGDSNIVIKFLGWIDQRETDWYKARSRAIPAVKDALEAEGFALPEPIYRLRFDAGTPLPMQQLEAGKPAGEPERPRSASVTVQDEPEDVRPQGEIAEMVEEERRASGPEDKDLLDRSRPVE